MSRLRDRADDYLSLRRALGHKLDDAHRLLPDFVAHLDAVGAETVTVEAALSWAQRPDADPATSVWARRMTVARGFARHMAGLDPNTEIPPVGLVRFRQQRRPPFIYSTADIAMLMSAARGTIPSPLRAATIATLIGLLGTTGMRVGEAIGFERCDLDTAQGVITVRQSKFGKSRLVPLETSTLDALGSYSELRDRHLPRPRSATFFVSIAGTRLLQSDFGKTFRKLLKDTGVGAAAPHRPRVHDLRHSFTVHTLVRWYRAGEDVGALMPQLTTYLGHRDPSSTFWYLSAAPELLALATGRLEAQREVGRP
jgi:integrase/recombinase XerD